MDVASLEIRSTDGQRIQDAGQPVTAHSRSSSAYRNDGYRSDDTWLFYGGCQKMAEDGDLKTAKRGA